MIRFLLLGISAIGFAGVLFAQDAADAPDGWRVASARPEVTPKASAERNPKDASAHTLILSANGNQIVDGRWERTVQVEAGKHYRFSAEYCAFAVATPARSVLARVRWLDAQGKQIGPTEFPPSDSDHSAGGWDLLADSYPAPEKATQAVLELHLRWTESGRVHFRNISFSPTTPPPPRKVKLAAVNHRPRNSPSPQANLEAFAKLIDEAAAQKADIVCLGEGITVVGTGKKYADVAEKIPGPSTEALARAAAKGKILVVAGLYERDGEAIYNTSVLIGRDGRLIGKYRKVCLPREESDGGITPGQSYPVFRTDIGRIGMMICWDLQFPEVARELAAEGAEIICLPIWGGNETLARARCIENGIYLVASGYDFRTAIYDRSGEVLAKAEKDPSVIVTEIDLSKRVYWPWIGDFRSRLWREAPKNYR